MPVFDMTENNFLKHPAWDVFTFGLPPLAIDLMISIEGFSFNEIYQRSVLFDDDAFQVQVIHKNDLIALKKRAGRSKDLDDLENLRSNISWITFIDPNKLVLPKAFPTPSA
jgi:hypothetical protein